MDFSLNEEQTLLKDSVTRYLESNYDFAERRRIAGTASGFSTEHWQQFAEFGWLTVPIAESVGGYGGRIEDTALMMEAFGRALVLEPFRDTILLAGQLIARSGNAAAVESVLPAIMAGEHQGALAAHERHGRQNLCHVETRVERRGEQWLLNGSKALVSNGAAADSLVVTAREAGATRDASGISLLLVPGDLPGVNRQAVPMMDGSRAAQITFDNVTLSADAVLGAPGCGWALLEPVIQEARIASCSEALGIIEILGEKTVEYARTRSQFGTPIGSFQALQHRMVDMFIAAQQSRSMLYRAICEYQQDEDSAPATLAAMKSFIGRRGREVGAEAIQLHGGMGMTDELDIGHYAKRLMMLHQLFGDSDAARAEFCARSYAA